MYVCTRRAGHQPVGDVRPGGFSERLLRLARFRGGRVRRLLALLQLLLLLGVFLL